MTLDPDRLPDQLQALADEISVLRPREVVIPAGSDVTETLAAMSGVQVPVTTVEGWSFDAETSRRTLLDQRRLDAILRQRTR